jgi:hypothetical protein
MDIKKMFKSFSKKLKKPISSKMNPKKSENPTSIYLKIRPDKQLLENQLSKEISKLNQLISQYKRTNNKNLIVDIDRKKIDIIRLSHKIKMMEEIIKRYRTKELLERRILKNRIIEE